MNKYYIEQINVSDNEYLITDIPYKNGDKINKEDVIFSYESSKTSFDCESDKDGFIYYNPSISLYDNYEVGYLIAIVSEEKIENPDNLFSESIKTDKIQGSSQPSDKIITKKAQKLIEKNDIDISHFQEEIITEDMILEFLVKNSSHSFQDIGYYYSHEMDFEQNNGQKKLAIIGAGKAALQLLDTVYELKDIAPVILYDANQSVVGKKLLGIEIKNLEIENIIEDFKNKLFDEIIISFSGNILERKKWFDLLVQKELPIANIFHPTCIISNFVNIGRGNIFFANTRIGPFAHVGNNNVVSSYCSFEHHNKLGNHNTFGPSVVFSGSCTIGNEIKFGTGIYIEPKVNIGNHSIISSGCIVQRNIPENSILKNGNKFEVKKIDK